MTQGWVSLHRQLCENDIWLDEPFTRGQAWVDMILLANHKAGHVRVRGNKIPLKRGQLGWSKDKLSERWKWSRNKVSRFLKELEMEQQIEQQKSLILSVVTIINYNKFQGSEATDEATDGRQTKQQTDTNNNDNNNDNNTPLTPQKGGVSSVVNLDLVKDSSVETYERIKALGDPIAGRRYRDEEYALFDEVRALPKTKDTDIADLTFLICYRILRENSLLNNSSPNMMHGSKFLEWIRMGINPNDIVDIISNFEQYQGECESKKRLGSWGYFQNQMIEKIPEKIVNRYDKSEKSGASWLKMKKINKSQF